MRHPLRHLVTRAIPALSIVLATSAPALAQLSPLGPIGRPPDAIDRSRQQSLTPIPRGPITPAPAQTWVPERRFYSPEYGRDLVVPGHYETQISPQQSAVPPITSYGREGQTPVLIPGGERPPADLRQGP